MTFMPKVGGPLVVTLPGEQMRAQVIRVVDQATVIVEIGQPMTRSHNFRLGDMVACRRTPGDLGEAWRAVEVRAPLPELPPAPPEKTAKPAKKTPKQAKNAPKSAKIGQVSPAEKGTAT